MPEAVWDRSSRGQVERKMRSSFIIERMFTADTRASDRSNARLHKKNCNYTSIYIHLYCLYAFSFFIIYSTVSPRCLDLSGSPQWCLCAAALHCGLSALFSGVMSLICSCNRWERQKMCRAEKLNLHFLLKNTIVVQV